MSARKSQAPAKLLASFVLLAGAPLLALGWMGWRVIEQDRVLEVQRSKERLGDAAELLAHELDRSLTAWESLLPAASEGGAVTVRAKLTSIRGSMATCRRVSRTTQVIERVRASNVGIKNRHSTRQNQLKNLKCQLFGARKLLGPRPLALIAFGTEWRAPEEEHWISRSH
jgi:hypothetical protein